MVGRDFVRQVGFPMAVIFIDRINGLAVRVTGDHLETFRPGLDRLRKIVSAQMGTIVSEQACRAFGRV